MFDTLTTIHLREGTDLHVAFENYKGWTETVADAIAGCPQGSLAAEVVAAIVEGLLQETARRGNRLGIGADAPSTVSHKVLHVGVADKTVGLTDGPVPVVTWTFDEFVSRFNIAVA